MKNEFDIKKKQPRSRCPIGHSQIGRDLHAKL
jgi:hypothetical protein